MGNTLDRQSVEYVLGSCRKESQNGKRAILLVLLEATSQAFEELSVQAPQKRRRAAYFSRAIRSLVMRSRASEILLKTYCPAM